MRPALLLERTMTPWSRPGKPIGVLALLLLASFAVQAPAQLPFSRLSWVHPAGARAGSTQEVTVGGSDFDAPPALLFSDPRITAVPKAGATNVFLVTVPADAPSGLREVRFAGRHGASNPRGFAVGIDREILLAGTNTAAASATFLPLDATANGRVAANQVLWFRFSAHLQQRVLIRVLARELDSRLVPDLFVTDAEGHELAVARRSSLLDFTAPAEGDFLLKVQDAQFRGGEEYGFRLTLSTAPYLDFAIPSVLRAGATNSVTLYGRNLAVGQPSALTGADGAPLQQLRVEILAPESAPPSPALLPAFPKPSAASLGDPPFLWPGNFSRPLERPIAFALTTQQVFRAQSPQVVEVFPPCDATLLFPRRDETSGVRFSARKGDVWWIEIVADRTGPNVDPTAVVQRLTRDAKGQEKVADVLELADTEFTAGGREFEASHRDAAGRFQVPDDGDYRVLVRDLFHRGANTPRFPYRITLRPETPGFALAAFPQPQPRRDDNDRQIHLWSTVLRRGETQPVRVVAFRQDGFNGEIELSLAPLPPGLVAAPARVPADQSATTIFLTAATNAPAAVAFPAILGRATVRGTSLVRTAACATARWTVPNWDQERGDARLAGGWPVSILGDQEAPLVIAPAETNRFEVATGAKVSIPLRVLRAPEFPAAFNLKPSGHPELDKAKEIAFAEKATNAVWELNLAETKLPEGLHVISLQAFVAGKFRPLPNVDPKDVNLRVYSEPILLRVLPAPKS